MSEVHLFPTAKPAAAADGGGATAAQPQAAGGKKRKFTRLPQQSETRPP